MRLWATMAAGAVLAGCLSDAPSGLKSAPPAETTVKMDFLHRPLPDIPLPNDIATRWDPTSATGRRLNASMVAPTTIERHTRTLLDELDGWGLLQPITVPFTAPLDPQSVMDAHPPGDYDTSDDVIYVIDIDEDSPRRGELTHLDLGQGSYPIVLERRGQYWEHDPRGDTMSLLFEEHDEDLNGNGVLDPGEDTDADGVLDKPNWLPGANPPADDLAARADALMTFYERETNTLIAKPMVPLRERTTYAVVITRRLLDAAGLPVGSPYPFVNHEAQTHALRDLPRLLPPGLGMEDVAFAFTFSTQTTTAGAVAVREGLYGHGVQAHLSEEFPAFIDEVIRLRDEEGHPNATRPHVLYTEQVLPALELIAQGLATGAGEEQTKQILESHRFIDFHVVGRFRSPQLFPREDEAGEPLAMNLQSWPPDLDRDPAEARSEDIWFWLAVPRKEVSARGEGKPAPLVLLSHSYATNHWEGLLFGGHIARHGFATLAIDHPSHGFEWDPGLEPLVRQVLGGFGIEGFADALVSHRSVDQNGDGQHDPGADFWTAYVFHTRDMVRQAMLDHMQLVRLVKSFDGERVGNLDANEDGQPELAGDFDGDGLIDIGGDAPMYILGGSLGGITSALIAAAEPAISATLPLVAGGGLADVGLRTQNGGVPQALILRLMGPLYLGWPDGRLETVVPDLNREGRRELGALPALEPGDTVIAENLDNGEHGCAYVQPTGAFRVSVESDRGDRHRLSFYRGGALIPGDTECGLREDAEPFATFDRFEREISWQGATIAADSPLTALGDGLGLRRANPELRRMLGLAQAVLDPADPAIWARHLAKEPLVYPHTGEITGANVMLMTTIGDMNVPVSTGVTLGRAAGIVDYLNDDPRYGKSPNQVLIDNWVLEAAHNLKRFTDPVTGEGVHIDVDNFAEGNDVHGDSIPRLDPPLRLVGPTPGDTVEGVSGLLFPYSIPEGEHAAPFPGAQTDLAAAACGCDDHGTFDTGIFFFNVLGRYLQTGGTVMSFDACQATLTCSWHPALPDLRSGTEIDE